MVKVSSFPFGRTNITNYAVHAIYTCGGVAGAVEKESFDLFIIIAMHLHAIMLSALWPVFRHQSRPEIAGRTLYFPWAQFVSKSRRCRQLLKAETLLFSIIMASRIASRRLWKGQQRGFASQAVAVAQNEDASLGSVRVCTHSTLTIFFIRR